MHLNLIFKISLYSPWALPPSSPGLLKCKNYFCEELYRARYVWEQIQMGLMSLETNK